jgi:hypothetical protein
MKNEINIKNINELWQTRSCQSEQFINSRTASNDENLTSPTKNGGVFLSNLEASEHFWIEAQRQKKFSLMFYFVLLKYRDNFRKEICSREDMNPFNDTKKNKEYFASLPKKNTHIDNTCGFIRKSQLKQIAKRLHTPYHTLRTQMPKLEQGGFLIKKETGWYMISMSRASAKLGVTLQKLTIKASTKKELKEKLALLVLKRIKRKREKLTHKTISTMPLTVSNLTLAKKLGYKSANTAVKLQKKLEADKKIIIRRMTVVKTIKPEKAYCILKTYKDYNYKKPCNEIYIVKKTA